MKFFIDTANLNEIREVASWGILDGVTTNPSLMAKEGITGEEKVREHYKTICSLAPDLSAEVISTDFDGMVREGESLASLHSNITVKIPMIREGIKAIKYFSSKGIRTNCTLVFNVQQAVLAARAGAAYVSPFVGRLDDIGQDGMELIATICSVFDNYGFETKVLAASIRHNNHIKQCMEMGVDIATCPMSVLAQMFHHPLTDNGLKKFLEDHAKMVALAGQKV
jgi:transaldolase